jgi:hypothetical protein
MGLPSHTAILLFSRTPSSESDEKVVLNKQYLNAKLHEALYARTVSTAQKSGLKPIIITERRQKGVTFGDKLAHAIRAVFELGYEHIITVGSDCAGLTVKDIRLAYNLLNKGSAVVGPDFRGGTYLIGLSKEGFDPESFARLPWQTPELCEALKQYTGAKTLTRKPDLNHRSDLGLIAASSESFHHILQGIFSVPHYTTGQFIPLLINGATPSHTRRGPPALTT